MRYILMVLLCSVVIPGTAQGAGERTVNTLTPTEQDRISQATLQYYTCVAEKALAITGGDRTSPERILATYPPFIRIVRQQCRVSLLGLEKDLYTLGLNPEYITNHVTTLRDDVQHYALQQVLRYAAEEKARAAEKAARDKEVRGPEAPKPRDASRLFPFLGGQGALVAPPAKPGMPDAPGTPMVP